MTRSHYECPGHGHKRTWKKIKLLSYIAASAVLLTIVILALVMIVMKNKSPKVQLGAVMEENYSRGGRVGTLVAEVTVKKTNSWDFEFENSAVEVVLYGGVKVGEGFIAEGRASARETKKFTVSVGVAFETLSRDDVNSILMVMSSHEKLSGKVHLVKVIKKMKSAEMDSLSAINLAMLNVQDLNCN